MAGSAISLPFFVSRQLLAGLLGVPVDPLLRQVPGRTENEVLTLLDERVQPNVRTDEAVPEWGVRLQQLSLSTEERSQVESAVADPTLLEPWPPTTMIA